MTDQIEMALAETELLIEVEQFLETNVGKYILGCREQDEKDAFDKLVDFDPYKFKTLGEVQSAISALQQDVLLAKKVHGYLSDAIIRGNQAEEILATIEED